MTTIYREQLAQGVRWLHLTSGFWSAPRRGTPGLNWYEEDLGNSKEAEELFILDLLEEMGINVEREANT